MTWKSEMGKILMEKRKRSGLSRKDLSSRLGCHAAQVQHWETGIKQIPLKYFVSLPEILNTTFEELFCICSDKIPEVK